MTVVLSAGLLVALPAADAAVRVPKTTWPVCKTTSDNYCVEGVSVTTPRGRTYPLTWVASGTATPNTTNNQNFSPIIAIDASKRVFNNSWWVDSNQLAAITNPAATFVDL